MSQNGCLRFPKFAVVDRLDPKNGRNRQKSQVENVWHRRMGSCEQLQIWLPVGKMRLGLPSMRILFVFRKSTPCRFDGRIVTIYCHCSRTKQARGLQFGRKWQRWTYFRPAEFHPISSIRCRIRGSESVRIPAISRIYGDIWKIKGSNLVERSNIWFRWMAKLKYIDINSDRGPTAESWWLWMEQDIDLRFFAIDVLAHLDKGYLIADLIRWIDRSIIDQKLILQMGTRYRYKTC